MVVGMVEFAAAAAIGFRPLSRVSVQGILKATKSADLTYYHLEPGGVLIVRIIPSVFKVGLHMWRKKILKQNEIQFLGSLALFSLFD